MKRMNLGCGSVQPAGWDNADAGDHGQRFHWSVRDDPDRCAERFNFGWTEASNADWPVGGYDYIVTNHMLSDVGHHDLVGALSNIRSMLKLGGVLRILVPDVAKAFDAWLVGNETWFPQDARTGDIDAKFCTFLTWFGESRSVFTWGYLSSLLTAAGFSDVSIPLVCGETTFGPEEITELDDRCTEALIVEALR